MNKNTFCWC